MVTCSIEWTPMTPQMWDGLIAKCDHVTLLQSYPYALAMRKTHQQNIRHAIISIDGVQAGIFQMQEVSLFKKMIQAISIDRGPLWFKGFGKLPHITAFAAALNAEFPPRFGRKRRFLPEFQNQETAMQDTGWTRVKKTKSYQTIMLDITRPLDKIRAGLKQRWRRTLTKAEKNNLTLKADWDGHDYDALIKGYMKDRLQKRYAGPSPKILSALAEFTIPRDDYLVLSATEDGETIASILIFLHGSCATYQVGWTTPYGRDKGAHHLLFWESIALLKTKKIKSFDLGGINEDIPGIQTFKEGLGGQNIALIGSYS